MPQIPRTGRRKSSRQIADAAVRRAALVKAALSPSTVMAMDRLRSEIANVDRDMKALPKPQWVYAAANYFEPQGTFRFAISPRPCKVLARGSVDSPGALAPPGALSCVPGLKPRFDIDPTAPEGERRAALARWITDSNNMLTWRSIVNRVWHYHFGAGIVDTPE